MDNSDVNQINHVKGKAERTAASYKTIMGYSSVDANNYVSNYYYKLIANAATEGETWAMHTLAYMYENGISVKKDIYEAFFWYEKGAKLGDDNCQLELFYFYKYGKISDANVYLAVFWLKQSAQKNNPVAQYNLALIYLEGTFEEVNYEECQKWLALSANRGIKEAMFCLGNLLENGLGGKVNYQEAYKWYLKACKLNHIEAQLSLAKLVFKEFNYNEKYIKKAVSILKKLIKLGNDEALYLLGAYYKELGESYYEQAFILFSEAATTYGNKSAIYEIGEMYEMGLGLPKDSVKALEYFNKVMDLI